MFIRTIDPAGMVCDTVNVRGTPFPTRCQAWFRLGNEFYVADSDSDRRAKVLRRTIKQ